MPYLPLMRMLRPTAPEFTDKINSSFATIGHEVFLHSIQINQIVRKFHQKEKSWRKVQLI